MIFTTDTNPRTKFNTWLQQNPPLTFVLDEPKRPSAFAHPYRLKALTEPAVAEVYVLQLPTRPAA